MVASDGRRLSCDQLVFAGGADLNALNRLLAVTGIAVDITSGQVSHVPETDNLVGLKAGISYGGYLTPQKMGITSLGLHSIAPLELTFSSSHYHNRFVTSIDWPPKCLIPELMAHGSVAVLARLTATPFGVKLPLTSMFWAPLARAG